MMRNENPKILRRRIAECGTEKFELVLSKAPVRDSSKGRRRIEPDHGRSWDTNHLVERSTNVPPILREWSE